jgi:acyl carrier protein
LTQPEILERLNGIFRDCFDDPRLQLRQEMTARDIAGWDSAKMVMLVLAVEEDFDVRLHSREIDALRCIGDWIALLERRLVSS